MPTEALLCRLRRPVLLASCAALAAGSLPAAAQSSPWFVSGQLSLTHDDNLLRLGVAQPAPAGQSRSDSITSIGLIAGLDQPVGRQRVQASLTLRDNRFDRNALFDNQAYTGNATLDWSTVNRISGQLSVGASRALSTFNADVIGPLDQRNYESTEGLNASLSAGLVTAWSVELSAGTRRVRNSLAEDIVQARNLDQDDAALGIAWRPGSALDLRLSLREVRGRFPSFLKAGSAFEDDRFTQRGTELALRWRASGASALDLRLGGGETTYERGGDRDFDNVTAAVGWSWQPTGKLALNTRLSRDEGQDNYPVFVGVLAFDPSLPGLVLQPTAAVQSDLRQIDTLRAQLDWSATAKLGLSVSLQQARRDVSSRTRTVADGRERRSGSGVDTTRIATVGVRWQPQRWTLLGCDLRQERRRADGNITVDLDGTSIGCYAQATLR